MTEAPHRFPVRVYYEDTDFSGVVYHASYLRFLERGRTELLRARGIRHADLIGGGAMAAFVVRHMSIDFRAAAVIDDALSVDTTVETLGGASMTLRQAVTREGAVLVAAVVRIGLVEGGRARRFPPGLAARLTGGTT